MKIAFVGPFPRTPATVFGGVAGASKYLAEELVKVPGVSVSVVVPQGAAGGAPTVEDWSGLRVYRLAKRGPWRRLPGTVYDIAAGKREVARQLERLAPDVVHFQGTSFLAAGCGRRSVLTIHGIAEKDALWDRRRGASRRLKAALLRATEDYGRRRAPNVILISDAVRAVLPDSRARRVWSIPNPVADSFFALERQPVPGRVLCCSRLTPLKNLHGMIEAFALLARRVPGAELRVAGAGDLGYLAQCRARARSLGVEGAVAFLGPLTVSRVQEELSRASCYALPSFQENAPLSLAEALAAGVPAAAARVGGVPEMIAHGETGLLLDPAQPARIADALEALLADPAFAEGLGSRAREAARERYRASEVARRTLDVYRQILEAA